MTDLVKPIAGILTGEIALIEEFKRELEAHLGAIDIVGELVPFDHTGYYEAEMGPDLVRLFVSFGDLMPAHEAAKLKKWTREIEDRHRAERGRLVNVDPGYIDANKVVLLTGKRGGHRLAIAPDIWADILLWYNKGWAPMPWSYPDFKDGRLFPLFTKMRGRFKEQLPSFAV